MSVGDELVSVMDTLRCNQRPVSGPAQRSVVEWVTLRSFDERVRRIAIVGGRPAGRLRRKAQKQTPRSPVQTAWRLLAETARPAPG
jgi:hypothetical protein